MGKKVVRESRVTRGMGASIPADVRRGLGIRPGDLIVWELEGDRAVVKAKRRRNGTFADFVPIDIGTRTDAARDHDEVI